MASLRKIFGLAQPTIDKAHGKERPRAGQPLTDAIPYKVDMAIHDCPGLSTELTCDCWTNDRMFKIGRMATDNFENMGEYVATMIQEFEDIRRCTVYMAPSNIFTDSMNTNLEHRLTVIRESGRVSIDESGRSSVNGLFDPALDVFLKGTPTLLDYNPGPGFDYGLRMVFGNLDRNSSSGNVYRLRKDDHGGMLAIMPFYYREPDNPSGVVVLEGDLRGRNSRLEGLSKAYWSAALAMNAAQQIGSQLVHRFDAITNLPRRADFQVDMKGSIRELIKHRADGNLYLMFVDLDDFKGINDRFTHPVGDEILRQVAERMQHSVRLEDAVFRVGGEEFAVIVHHVSYDEAKTIAERIRRNIESITVMVRHGDDGRVEILNREAGNVRPPQPDAELAKVTCSIGISDVRQAAGDSVGLELPPNGKGDKVVQEVYDIAYGIATKRLHEAKGSGKNCICFAEEGGGRIYRAALPSGL